MQDYNNKSGDKSSTISPYASAFLFLFAAVIIGLFAFFANMYEPDDSPHITYHHGVRNVGYHDRYLYFSDIKAGMNGWSADEHLQESCWFEKYMEGISKETIGNSEKIEYYDPNLYELKSGAKLRVSAIFDGRGVITSVFSKITHPTSNRKLYERYTEYYKKDFIRSNNLQEFSESGIESPTYKYLKNELSVYGSDPELFDKFVITIYDTSDLRFDEKIHKVTLWTKEDIRTGYAMIELTNVYNLTSGSAVYSFVFINFLIE